MFVCLCHAITEEDLVTEIRKQIKLGEKSFNKIYSISNKCGKCINDIAALIEKEKTFAENHVGLVCEG